MAIQQAKIGKKFAKVAMGKVQQSIPTTDASVTSIGNRVSVLEGYNLHSRLTTAEGKITILEGKMTTAEDKITTLQSQVSTLMTQMASILTHKHDYDDGGVAKITGTPRQ